MRKGYRKGHGEVLGALGFVTNAVMPWNTVYMDAALVHLVHLARIGFPVSEEDQERLSPLGFAHINFHGRFRFDLPETVQQGQLRPLRTPKHRPNPVCICLRTKACVHKLCAQARLSFGLLAA